MSDSAHPLLPAGTPVLRSPDGSVRIGGIGPTAGLLAGGAAGWVAGLLPGLDGRRPQRAVVADGVRAGVPAADVRSLLAGLRAAGLLVDLDAADLLAADAGPAAAARTALELPAAGGGGARWSTRRTSTVLVDGATRVGVPLAAVLAASGVGHVPVRDAGSSGAGDVVVGGITAADEGRPRAMAAADAVRRASPLADLRPLADPARADLVVLTRPEAACDPLAAELVEAGVPHLVATTSGQSGVVGPLVVPGRTGCLSCADLHRRDADPAWPALVAQLGARAPVQGGATTTCLLTAVTAAVQVLAHLDGTGAPVTLGAAVELRPPELAPRVRLWPAHPACGCGAARPRSGHPGPRRAENPGTLGE